MDRNTRRQCEAMDGAHKADRTNCCQLGCCCDSHLTDPIYVLKRCIIRCFIIFPSELLCSLLASCSESLSVLMAVISGRACCNNNCLFCQCSLWLEEDGNRFLNLDALRATQNYLETLGASLRRFGCLFLCRIFFLRSPFHWSVNVVPNTGALNNTLSALLCIWKGEHDTSLLAIILQSLNSLCFVAEIS